MLRATANAKAAGDKLQTSFVAASALPDDSGSGAQATAAQLLFGSSTFPAHLPLRSKVQLMMQVAAIGQIWEILQILLSLLACGLYVASTYGLNGLGGT